MKKKRKQEAVLAFLRSYKDPRNGLCTPSMKEIAAAVGISRDYAAHLIKQLAAVGTIEKTEGWRFGEGEFTTDYREAAVKGDQDFSRGPNLYRITLVLLLFVLLCPTVSDAASASVVEALCYKSAIAILFAHLLKKYFQRRLEAL